MSRKVILLATSFPEHLTFCVLWWFPGVSSQEQFRFLLMHNNSHVQVSILFPAMRGLQAFAESGRAM
jgi:hypothetical protein